MWWVSFLVACVSGVADIASSDPSESEGNALTDPSDTENPAPTGPPVASGLDITKISIYQAVEIELFNEKGLSNDLQAPIIKGRDALLRIFVDPHADWEDRKIDAVVTVGDDVLTATKKVQKVSVDETLGTTINIDIPGNLLDKKAEIEVSLVESDGVFKGFDDGVVAWRSEDDGGLDVEITDALEIVIIPVKYNYDGSGRMPDTSQAQLDDIRDLFAGMYPASEVTVSVGQTLNWSRQITAFSGWDDLLWTINGMRGNANESPNTYYYGMFRPTDSFNAFCQSGCILGLSFLGLSANDPWYRASIGIGYTGDYSTETVPHEVGHAHGREHAPCGLYGQPSDPAYPHNNANLGTWGYDLVNEALIAPKDGKDVMSYCGPMWISDYTYYHLYRRIQDVGRQNRSVTHPFRAIRVTPEGEVVPGEVVQLATPTGEPVEVQMLDAVGRDLGAETGWFVPYDHLPGGVIMVPDRADLFTVRL